MKHLTTYNLSTNYEKLYILASSQVIVCEVDYYFSKDDKIKSRDICSTRKFSDGSIEIGSRGICYILAKNLEDFCLQCKSKNLKWILPIKNEKNL
jgi:hypothetical protein